MLACTTLRDITVSDPAPPFFWSEIVTLRITLAYNPNAPDGDKTKLHSEFGGANPAEAWLRAIRGVSEAALVGTSVSLAAADSTVAAAASSSETSATATAAMKKLDKPPSMSSMSSSSAAALGSRHRQAVEPTIVLNSNNNTSVEPAVSIVVTLPVPYSSVAAAAAVTTTATNDYSNNNNEQPAAAQLLQQRGGSFRCEWELLVMISRAVGPTRAPMIHSDAFAVIRHAVPVSTALFVACKSFAKGSSNSSGGMIVSVACRNCCEYRVKIQHVELEPSSWTAAAILQQQKQQQQQQQSLVAATNPWVVRRKAATATSIATSASSPSLMQLSDALPVTLKPTECYTFCFDVPAAAMSSASGNNSNTSSNSNPAVTASAAAVQSMLFVARATVSGRPILVNHVLQL